MSQWAPATIPRSRLGLGLIGLTFVGTYGLLGATGMITVDLNPGIAVAGLLVGVLIGLTGMGSGSLMAPLLILVVGVPPATAIGTDLVYAAMTKTVGSIQHARQRSIDFHLVRLLAMGSMPAAFLGVQLLDLLRRTYSVVTLNTVIMRALGLTLALVALTILFDLARRSRRRARSVLATLEGTSSRPAGPASADDTVGSAQLGNRKERLLPVFGAVVGLLVGVTSVGSGAIVVALLSMLSPLTARRIVGTDIAHAALLTAAAGLAHVFADNVDLWLLLNLLAGSIPGVLVGSRLATRLPEPALRAVLACLLLVTGVRLV